MLDVLSVCKTVAAEGTVLLKNDTNLLPLKSGTRLAVFGRMQTSYYRSGTGSGGGVYLREIPCILNSLKSNPDLCLDEKLIGIYEDWVKDNPFDDGGGVWAGEPWFQKEMPLTEETVKRASCDNEVALVIIGRTAGEDHDNADVEGSYRLTEMEENMLSLVCEHFSNVVVAINTGNMIDLSFVDKYNVKSVLYIWQGGMEGANAFSDILSGKLYPSGKLADTQLLSLDDHPAMSSFGEGNRIVYDDDIYVGYRYYETFYKDKVRYPFGYGLSYTDFDVSYSACIENDEVTITAEVKNIGSRCGKEVIQVYYEAPGSNIGNPSRQLVEFVKTKELEPDKSQVLNIKFPLCRMASFDENGEEGYKSCFVLLKGDYRIYAGTDVRTAKPVITYNSIENKVTETLSSAMKPFVEFNAIKAKGDTDRKITYRKIDAEPTDINDLRAKSDFSEILVTFDRGIKLADVYEGKNNLDEFIAQFSDLDLATLVCGEGMSSPKSTPGTAGALGGQTESLSSYGIPVCCVADGPSGLKISPGIQTTLIPNGTMVACTWNTELISELYSFIGKELKMHEVDSLLGPGLNIHRTPLCGRNFEYFSEDPLLSGKMGAAATRGIAREDCYSTIKHFCCNNQEKARAEYDVAVSQRALREIYLKPFEITVKEGKNVLIMTSYNAVNGFWCASNYDLTSTILRKEWGFENIVMTDWWAKCNRAQGESGHKEKVDAMVWSQNDLYMVCEDSLVKSNSIIEALNNGTLLRSELQLSCKRLCEWIMKTNTFKDYVKRGCVPKYPIAIDTDNLTLVDSINDIETDKGYVINVKSGRNTAFIFKLSSDLDSLAQIPITVKVDSSQFTLTVSGTNGEEKEFTRFVKTDWWNEHKITLSYSNAVKINCIYIKQKQ